MMIGSMREMRPVGWLRAPSKSALTNNGWNVCRAKRFLLCLLPITFLVSCFNDSRVAIASVFIHRSIVYQPVSTHRTRALFSVHIHRVKMFLFLKKIA